jgi:hypothetical protein
MQCSYCDDLAIILVGFVKTMIKDRIKLDEVQRKLDAEERLSYTEALAIYEMLHKEAVSLGVINSENILDGLEVDLRIAKAINQVGL